MNIKKIAVNILKGVIKEIPIVGGLIHNTNEDTEDSPKGSLSWQQVVGQVGFYALMAYLTYLSMDNQDIKDIIKILVRNI